MAQNPRGERRPAEIIGCEVAVASQSVSYSTDALTRPSGRMRSGHAGAKACVEATTGEQRREIAQKAAETRWA